MNSEKGRIDSLLRTTPITVKLRLLWRLSWPVLLWFAFLLFWLFGLSGRLLFSPQ